MYFSLKQKYDNRVKNCQGDGLLVATVMNQQDIQDRLNDLHSILSIDHRNTSSFLRTKTSATDNRPSSVQLKTVRNFGQVSRYCSTSGTSRMTYIFRNG
jgi:hypothetical protein